MRELTQGHCFACCVNMQCHCLSFMAVTADHSQVCFIFSFTVINRDSEITLKQQIFLCDSYMENKFYKSCERFCYEYHGVLSSSFVDSFQINEKICSTGSFLDKRYTRQNAMLTVEILDESGARLERLPHKSLAQLAQKHEFIKQHGESLESYICGCIK
jgi:hypothetical protein